MNNQILRINVENPLGDFFIFHKLSDFNIS